MAYNSNVLPKDSSESSAGSDNNLYVGKFEKVVSNDAMANGMGISVPATEKGFEQFPGSGQSETNKLRERELARFSSLKPAMGRNIPITNAGIVIDSFGGSYGEQKRNDGELSADREQPRSRPNWQE